MTASTYYSPFIPAFSSNGAPVYGAKLNFYLTGTTTRTPIYADSGLIVEHTNPVIADASGRYPNIYLDSEIIYKVVQTDRNDVPIGDAIDPYIPGTALKGDTGDTGPADNTYTNLTAFKAQAVTNKVATLKLAGADAVPYSWVEGDFSAISPDDSVYIKSDDNALTVGIWRNALATTGGAVLVGTASGSTLADDLLTRGTLIPNQVVTTPLALTVNRNHFGSGRIGQIRTSGEAGGLSIPQPGGGDYNYWSTVSNVWVLPDADYEDAGDYACEVSFSAYGTGINNKYWGGQLAAFKIDNGVGHYEINQEASRSSVGHLLETVGGANSTVQTFVGGTTNIVGTAIQSDGRLDFLSYKGRAFDFFNDLVADDGLIYNLSFDDCWFEAFGHGLVSFPVDGGGRIGAPTTNYAGRDGKVYLGSAIAPRFNNPTFVEEVTLSGGMAPILKNPHCATNKLRVDPNTIADGIFHIENMTGGGTGSGVIDTINLTLPQYGSHGTVYEHYGRSSAHTSLAVAELSGVNFATGLGHTNKYTSRWNAGAWVNTATATTGQADPWGGTTAIQMSGTAGQGSTNYNTLGPDEKAVMQVLLRATTVGAEMNFFCATTNGGVSPYQRQNIYQFPDTNWRIITIRVHTPQVGDYLTGFRLVSGAFDIAAEQLTDGYDLKPILRAAQTVTGPFQQVDQRIIQQKSAIPVSGNYWAGDEIVYPAATAATRKRRGAICTVGDGSSVGTWIETGIVANPGAAIADIVGTPTQANHNAVLAALRAAGIIAT